MGAAAKDMTITADTKMRLLADSDVPALDVNVDTFNRTVTLWGSVPTQQAKAAAEADAHKVGGVTRVVNELQVVPIARKEQVKARDDDLKQEVKKAIDARENLKGSSISVDVKNGVARLTGTVEDEQQRLEAAIAARSTPGVRAVPPAEGECGAGGTLRPRAMPQRPPCAKSSRRHRRPSSSLPNLVARQALRRDIRHEIAGRRWVDTRVSTSNADLTRVLWFTSIWRYAGNQWAGGGARESCLTR